MGSLLYICPRNNQTVPTGIIVEKQSLKTLWDHMIEVRCTYCLEGHRVFIREIFFCDNLMA